MALADIGPRLIMIGRTLAAKASASASALIEAPPWSAVRSATALSQRRRVNVVMNGSTSGLSSATTKSTLRHQARNEPDVSAFDRAWRRRQGSGKPSLDRAPLQAVAGDRAPPGLYRFRSRSFRPRCPTSRPRRTGRPPRAVLRGRCWSSVLRQNAGDRARPVGLAAWRHITLGRQRRSQRPQGQVWILGAQLAHPRR